MTSGTSLLDNLSIDVIIRLCLVSTTFRDLCSSYIQERSRREFGVPDLVVRDAQELVSMIKRGATTIGSEEFIDFDDALFRAGLKGDLKIINHLLGKVPRGEIVCDSTPILLILFGAISGDQKELSEGILRMCHPNGSPDARFLLNLAIVTDGAQDVIFELHPGIRPSGDGDSPLLGVVLEEVVKRDTLPLFKFLEETSGPMSTYLYTHFLQRAVKWGSPEIAEYILRRVPGGQEALTGDRDINPSLIGAVLLSTDDPNIVWGILDKLLDDRLILVPWSISRNPETDILFLDLAKNSQDPILKFISASLNKEASTASLKFAARYESMVNPRIVPHIFRIVGRMSPRTKDGGKSPLREMIDNIPVPSKYFNQISRMMSPKDARYFLFHVIDPRRG